MHKYAIQTRNPSLYYYETPFFREVEKHAQHAKARKELTSEIDLMRAELLGLVAKLQDSNQHVTSSKTDKDGNYLPISDAERINLLAKATTSIAGIMKTHSDISNKEFVSVDNLKIWLGDFANQIKRVFPDVADQKKFIEILSIIGEPKTG